MKVYSIAALAVLAAVLWLAVPPAVRDAGVLVTPAATPQLRLPVDQPAPGIARIPGRVAVQAATKPAARPQIRQIPIPKPRPPDQDFWLHAGGSQMYTAWDQRITLKAINWYGFEYAPFVPGGLDKNTLDSILATVRKLGFNALRLTFADATVETNPIVRAGVRANPQLRGLHSLDIMQRIIQRAHHFGLRVILCNSRSEAGWGPETETGLWYTKAYPPASWVADWETLARRFRADSAFVGADLRNEPHLTGGVFSQQAYFTLGPLWGAYHGVYYHDRDWHYAAETLGNDLLAINPHLLIIVEGVQIYLDPYRNVLTGGLWGSNLDGVQYDPIVLDRPGQLVYSVHEYGPNMWQGSWFSPRTTYAGLARRWEQQWGYLLTASRLLRAPIFVGEFGTCHQYWACISSDQPWKQGFWFRSFVRYLKAHPRVGWAYWALNPVGPFRANEANFYSLLSANWRHYYPLLTSGLAPLLSEPNGLGKSTGRLGLKVPTLSPQAGCAPMKSCRITLPDTISPKFVSRPVAPRQVRVTNNVPYGNSPREYQAGNLYVPIGGTQTRPAVVVVRDGTWAAGSKDSVTTTGLARALALHGYVVYAINVRPANGTGGPETNGSYPRDIRDVKSAVEYLVLNAARLRIDTGKIALAGTDAGGYLAEMAAYTRNRGWFAPRADASALPTTGPTAVPPTPQSPSVQNTGLPNRTRFFVLQTPPAPLSPSVKIAAVASFFAPADLQGLGHAALNPIQVQQMSTYLAAGYPQNPLRYRAASPKMHVKGGVPTIFFDGRDDTAQPFPQTFKLYRYLKQHGLESQLIDLPGAPRHLADLTSADRQNALTQVFNFLDGIFYSPPS